MVLPWVGWVRGGRHEGGGALVELADGGGGERHDLQGARAVGEADGAGGVLGGEQQQQPVTCHVLV